MTEIPEELMPEINNLDANLADVSPSPVL